MANDQNAAEESLHPPDDSGGGRGRIKQGWASIASLNVSKRKKTNTLEIRLENLTNTGC